MYLRRVRFARVESHPHILCVRISDHFLHAIDFHQRFAQGANAFVAIVSISRDIDPFPDGLISGVVEIVRIGWIHALTSHVATRPSALSRLASAQGALQNRPDICRQNFLASRVGMNQVRQTEGRISSHALEKEWHQLS